MLHSLSNSIGWWSAWALALLLFPFVRQTEEHARDRFKSAAAF